MGKKIYSFNIRSSSVINKEQGSYNLSQRLLTTKNTPVTTNSEQVSQCDKGTLLPSGACEELGERSAEGAAGQIRASCLQLSREQVDRKHLEPVKMNSPLDT